jgi:pyruvate formate lyase activating enzyme
VKALYWHRAGEGKVECELCPHGCRLDDGGTGRCRVRQARGGELQAAAYGCVSSANLDPIEKKPLYHFLPGSMIFSIGGWGCNLRCTFCQNWTLSQRFTDDGRRYAPRTLVEQAQRCESRGIAYTYNEPLVGYEFVRDCARLAHAAGLRNVLVTNGFVNAAPAEALLPLIDALNIDVKSMDPAFYERYCGGRLEPVLAFAEQAFRAGCHVEITNLVIPGLNDADDGFEKLAAWIGSRLATTVPLHLSAYHPQYKLDAPPTPPDLLQRAYRLSRRTLRYVYLGNVRGMGEGSDTYCPCGALLVERRGYTVAVRSLKGSACANCGRPADVVNDEGVAPSVS